MITTSTTFAHGREGDMGSPLLNAQQNRTSVGATPPPDYDYAVLPPHQTPYYYQHVPLGTAASNLYFAQSAPPMVMSFPALNAAHSAPPPSYDEVVFGLGVAPSETQSGSLPRQMHHFYPGRHRNSNHNVFGFRQERSPIVMPELGSAFRDRSAMPYHRLVDRGVHRRVGDVSYFDERIESSYQNLEDRNYPEEGSYINDIGEDIRPSQPRRRAARGRRDVGLSPVKPRNSRHHSDEALVELDADTQHRLQSLAQQLEEENAALESKLAALRGLGPGTLPPALGVHRPLELKISDSGYLSNRSDANPPVGVHSTGELASDRLDGEHESEILRSKRRIEEIVSKQIDLSRVVAKPNAVIAKGSFSESSKRNTSFWGGSFNQSSLEEDKYVADLLAMKKEMDYLRQKAALNELKDEIETQKMQRKAERELEEWLVDKKHKMQTLRVKKALALEQLRYEEEMQALGVNIAKIDIGIEKNSTSDNVSAPSSAASESAMAKPSLTPEDSTSTLFEFSIDGLLLPGGVSLEGNMMRVVCAFVDSVDGATIGRMVASNWQSIPKEDNRKNDAVGPFSALGGRRGRTPQSRPPSSSRPAADVGGQPTVVPLFPFPLLRRITDRESELFKLSMRLPSNQLTGIMGAPKYCSHLRIMVELQVKDGEAGISRASGWCTLDPSKAMSVEVEQQADVCISGGDGSSIGSLPPRQAQFGAWRAEMRLGVADSSIAPETRLRTARGIGDVDTSAIVSTWLLFRINPLAGEAKEPSPVSSITASLERAVALDKVLKTYPRYVLSDIYKNMKIPEPQVGLQEQTPPVSSRSQNAQETRQVPLRDEGRQKLEPLPEEVPESKEEAMSLSYPVSAILAAKQLATKVQGGGKLDSHGLDELREKLWQRGTSIGVATIKYHREAGIDVYIDSAMNLPDNVTVSRVVVKILTSEMDVVPINRVQSVITGVSYCMGDVFSPTYDLKVECRAPVFNCTCTLLIRIDCLDAVTLQTCGVGYAAVNLLCSKSRDMLHAPSDPGAHINTGNFQLPIHGGIVSRISTGFSKATLSNNPKLPCASLLVRIVEAPKSSDGLATLSCSDVPDMNWAAMGLKIPAPSYKSGAYDGVACEPTQDDIICFAARQNISRGTGSVSSVQSVVNRVLSSRSSHSYPPMPDGLGVTEEIIQNWLESLLGGADAVGALLDYSFAVPYSSETGVWLNVLALHNVPDSGLFSSRLILYKVIVLQNYLESGTCPTLFVLLQTIFSLCPPTLYYRDPPLSEGVHFTLGYDMQSSVRAPVFVDGSREVYPSRMNEQAHIVLDIRTIVVEKGKKNVSALCI
jgi:hypothetical protein